MRHCVCVCAYLLTAVIKRVSIRQSRQFLENVIRLLSIGKIRKQKIVNEFNVQVIS